MRKLAVFTLVSLSTAVFGCAPGTYESDESEELTAEAEGALVGVNAINPNAINPNAINPNAINPNAINPNAINPNSIAPSVLTALQNPGEAGDLSRMHMKYLVSCALTPEQSFSFSWTDSSSVVHNETYWGNIGLASAWASRGINETEQRWVSACMASRTNYYSTTVLISMRGPHTSLSADTTERGDYAMREGAFWGNIFAETPYLYACHDPANMSNSRAKLRECAAGHVDGGTTVQCGIINIVGPCNELVGDPAVARCPTPGTSGDGYASCADAGEVITTYLPL